MTKYVFVTGGVVSSLGKGIASASIGKLLESKGFKVELQKCDPYLNVDPGTMNPYQHGEVYVTEDGAEADLDLGHYERFTSCVTTRDHNITTGKIYYSVIMKERRGDFLGGTVQVVPHITDEIKAGFKKLGRPDVDVVICEIGGTVGDIESLPFLEAIRQLRLEMGRGRVVNIHLTLVPYIKAADEIKTKPTQHSVGKLREIGIQPEILLCRTEKPLAPAVRQKIALFCNVMEEAVIEAHDVQEIYEVPLMFKAQGLDRLICRLLGLKMREEDLKEWEQRVVRPALHPSRYTRIAVVGKYTELQDAYKSIYEALRHGGIANDARVDIQKIAAEEIEKHGASAILAGMDGILVPGGFGSRAVEGKVQAITYAREQRIPFFGVCLGMQCAVIEFARSVLGLKGANSTEFNPKTPHPVICLLEEQKKVKRLGGTMRLGAYRCRVKRGTLAHQAYRQDAVNERHRHRYEFNNHYRAQFERRGIRCTGSYPRGSLVEIIELKGHPWFVAVQFHPEFKSKPIRAHPLFREFVKSAIAYRENTQPQYAVSQSQ